MIEKYIIAGTTYYLFEDGKVYQSTRFGELVPVIGGKKEDFEGYTPVEVVE